MKYTKTIKGTFHSRPNRFIAYVTLLDSDTPEPEKVHVKNTGRCRELLLPGADVILEKSDNPNRKTKYDLVSVWKENLGWVNIDSQTPNKVAGEWLQTQGFTYIKPEYKYGNSRIDFYMERDQEKYLMEVKGCTLEIDGIGYFPDAPTERGVKHLKELKKAVLEGYHAAAAFVIQMNGINEVRPNIATHPEFGEAMEEAMTAGVDILFIRCSVTEDEVRFLPMSWK
ncbi:MAG: DNA/RNA nuclease SfsA [Lachnospiraceae bacterium]|nr:DNA/RNA nuclease SfsA [Lachnospiraceae bacterium]